MGYMRGIIKLNSIFLFLFICLHIEMYAEDIIIDNDNGSPCFLTTGKWNSSSLAGYNGGTYLFDTYNSKGTAVWTPDLPVSGLYKVYAAFVMADNRTKNAPFLIKHADGTATVNINQCGTPEQHFKVVEVLLGVWYFNAGTGGNVTLSTTGGPGIYIADAVIFRPIDDEPAVISNISHAPYYPADSQTIVVSVKVEDDISVKSVHLFYAAESSRKKVKNSYSDLIMEDNGLLYDKVAGDSIYTASLPEIEEITAFSYYISVTDSTDHITTTSLTTIEIGKTPQFKLSINELIASNVYGAKDPDFNENADWIEIVNSGPDIADLELFALSDDEYDEEAWSFPSGLSLAPGEYIIVWADGKNTTDKSIHADFKLSADGESIVLYDKREGAIEDTVTFGKQISDQSYARFPDKTGEWKQTEKPTPGSPNEYVKSGDAPVISIPSGIFSASFQTEITAPASAEIHYTLDSSIPELTSAKYQNPISVSSTKILRARAFYDDFAPSPIVSASYLFNMPSDRKIPIMNITIDPDDFNGPEGIYTNSSERGLDWEKPCCVSVYSPDGKLLSETGAGLRIHGGNSRILDKKSLRLYFRSLYGKERWSLPWMIKSPVNSFTQLVLRANANDSFLGGSASNPINPVCYRDQIIRDWNSDMGLRAADGFFMALYINGQYWGLYNTTERISEDFLHDSFGDEDWDVVKGSWDSARGFFTETTDGDLVEWNQLIDWVENHDLSKNDDYETFCEMFDTDSFLKYFALNIICQNQDWPHNNWIAAKVRGEEDSKDNDENFKSDEDSDESSERWKLYEWDAEWGLGLYPAGSRSDSFRWARGNNSMLQHQGTIAPLSLIFSGNDYDTSATKAINGLLDNPAGKKKFVSSVEEALNFELLPENAEADASKYENLIREEILLEAERWASSTGTTTDTLIIKWNAGNSDVHNFLKDRPAYVRSLMIMYFGLTGTKTISFTKQGAGSGCIKVNGRTAELPWSGIFFTGSEIEILPLPDSGSAFSSWNGAVQSQNPKIIYTVANTIPAQFTVDFGIESESSKPNDVIFNEYWLNDNSTQYASIENRAIDGNWIELLVIKDKIDMRGWRITNNNTLSESGTATTGGSLIFPQINALKSVPAGTVILIISKVSDLNAASFPNDETDTSTKRMIFYAGNGNLDLTTNPGFSIATANEALVLLAPGATQSFSDDIGIDFIAEGSDVTPVSFGVSDQNVIFSNPFTGIGGDDGAVFLNDASGGFNNDNGEDANRDDFLPGAGGWIADPPKTFSGDDTAAGSVNWLTPGMLNHGQNQIPKISGSWLFLF